MKQHLKINPYLNFDGTTEEAFRFYKEVFGGEYSEVMRFNQMPPTEQPMPKEEGERIMHIALPIGDDAVLMASDISKSMGQKLTPGNNVYLSIHPESEADARRLYEALSGGGKVEMPFEKMFWGAYFSSFTDKFGVQWMINYQEK